MESAIDLLDQSWANFNTEQKKRLLRSRGLNESWAETKTIKEMVARGGGMIASDLLRLHKEYIKRKGMPNVDWSR